MANEKRLIDADAEIEAIKKYACEDCESHNGIRCRACWADDLIGWIEDAPKVDAVEVVHAEWLDGLGVDHDGKIVYESIDCSACEAYIKVESNDIEYWKERLKWCPFCGAKMDGN